MQTTVMSSRPLVAKKAFTAAVAKPSRVSVARVSCSAEQKRAINKEALVAGVMVGVGAAMANPLVAEAAVTPSLKNLLNSVVAGGVVLGAIVAAVSAVSAFDPIRK